MRRIYRKMRVALLSFCVLTAVLSTGCSAEETGQSEISEEVYQLGNQEIQIDGKTQYVNNAIKIYCKSVFDALNENDSALIRFYGL